MFDKWFNKLSEAPRLQAIFISPVAGGAVFPLETAQAVSGKGLAGDRYAAGKGFWRATDACQVTLISNAELAKARQSLPLEAQIALDKGSHRRNLVIADINIKQLEKREFRIGSAIFRWHKPRPPCAYLDTVAGAGMCKALRRGGGICLQVVADGILSVGDALEYL